MFEFADLYFDFDAKLISGERVEIINLDKFAYILEKEKKIMNRRKRVDTPPRHGTEEDLRSSARRRQPPRESVDRKVDLRAHNSAPINNSKIINILLVMGTKGMEGSQIASQGCLSSQADFRRLILVNCHQG